MFLEFFICGSDSITVNYHLKMLALHILHAVYMAHNTICKITMVLIMKIYTLCSLYSWMSCMFNNCTLGMTLQNKCTVTDI